MRQTEYLVVWRSTAPVHTRRMCRNFLVSASPGRRGAIVARSGEDAIGQREVEAPRPIARYHG